MFLFILTWVRIAEGFTLNAWMEMEFNPNPGAVKTGGLPGTDFGDLPALRTLQFYKIMW